MLVHVYLTEATLSSNSGGRKMYAVFSFLPHWCHLLFCPLVLFLLFPVYRLVIPSFVDGWCSRQLTARTHCWLFCFIATTDWHVCPLTGYQPYCLSPKERRPKTILLMFVRSIRLRSTMSLTLMAVALSTSIVEDQLDHVPCQTEVRGFPEAVEGETPKPRRPPGGKPRWWVTRPWKGRPRSGAWFGSHHQ